jgi:hypothetical protein
MFSKGFIGFSSVGQSTSKVAFAESVAENHLPVLLSVHLPHDDGGGPAAFAEETSVPTIIVGVFILGSLCLRILRATKHLANFILPSEQPNSTHILSENKFKAAFAEVVNQDILLVGQQFTCTFRVGDRNHAVQYFFRKNRSPPFEAKTPITSGTKVHQDVYDRASRHFAGCINLHSVSISPSGKTFPKQRWHG